MSGIKYYQLAKDEELPDEFCAIRDVDGEPSEYTFYEPEAENAELRHDLEEANNQAEEVCIENAKLREDLEFERSENGWAREFLNRMGQKCGTKDCPSLVAYVTKLEAENARLWELVDYMTPIAIYAASEQERDRMHELGVEVE